MKKDLTTLVIAAIVSLTLIGCACDAPKEEVIADSTAVVVDTVATTITSITVTSITE